MSVHRWIVNITQRPSYANDMQMSVHRWIVNIGDILKKTMFYSWKIALSNDVTIFFVSVVIFVQITRKIYFQNVLHIYSVFFFLPFKSFLLLKNLVLSCCSPKRKQLRHGDSLHLSKKKKIKKFFKVVSCRQIIFLTFSLVVVIDFFVLLWNTIQMV